MRRRDALQLLGSAAAAAWVVPASADTSIPFAVAGRGPALLTLKPHGGDHVLLTERYRVAVLDYPTTEMLNARDVWAGFTPDRVCSDILRVADTMGVRSFAFYGLLLGRSRRSAAGHSNVTGLGAGNRRVASARGAVR